MRKTTVRGALTLAAVLLALPARRAAADVTVTGIVGELGVIKSGIGCNYATWVRFKLTDTTLTSMCTDQIKVVANNSCQNPQILAGSTAKYAWFPLTSQPPEREWYAQLLYSKKGAPITCTVATNNGDCSVTSCTLP